MSLSSLRKIERVGHLVSNFFHTRSPCIYRAASFLRCGALLHRQRTEFIRPLFWWCAGLDATRFKNGDAGFALWARVDAQPQVDVAKLVLLATVEVEALKAAISAQNPAPSVGLKVSA